MNKFLCKRCLAEFDEEYVDEHHVIPQSICKCDYWRIHLCKRCHDWVTQLFMQKGLIWLPNGKELREADAI